MDDARAVAWSGPGAHLETTSADASTWGGRRDGGMDVKEPQDMAWVKMGYRVGQRQKGTHETGNTRRLLWQMLVASASHAQVTVLSPPHLSGAGSGADPGSSVHVLPPERHQPAWSHEVVGVKHTRGP